MSQATATDAAADFFSGTPGQSAKFETIGDKVGGIITDYSVTQQIDFDTDEPIFWDEDKTQPAMQLVISLQTEERDPLDAEDEGIRKLYIKGSKKSGSQSPHDAVASACRRAGVKSVTRGGYLEMQFVGEEAPKKKGMSPRKLYTANYNPMAGTDAAAAELLGTAPAAAPAPAVQYVQPVQQQLAQPAAAPVAAPAPVAQAAPAAAPAAATANPVDLARQLITANQPDSIVQAATGLDLVVIQALRNAG